MATTAAASVPTAFLIMMDAFAWLTKLISSLNLLVTYPIYISLLFFLHRRRFTAPFNSSFYRLFWLLGIVDLTKYSLYLLKKCSYWGWVPSLFLPFDSANLWAQLLYMSLWGLSFAQYQFNFLLSLNRFLSILFPQIYRHRWCRQLFLWAIWPVALSSLLIVLPILRMPVCFRTTQIHVEQTNGSNGTTVEKFTGPVFMDNNDLILYYMITKCFVVLLLVACLTGYPLCFARVRRMNMLDNSQAIEVKMLYALALLLVANLLYAAYFITWEILSHLNPQLSLFAEWSLYLIIDFYDMNSPYGLLLTSKLVRQSIFPFRFFRRENAILPEKTIMTYSSTLRPLGGGAPNGYGCSTNGSGGGGGGGARGSQGSIGIVGARHSSHKPPFWDATMIATNNVATNGPNGGRRRSQQFTQQPLSNTRRQSHQQKMGTATHLHSIGGGSR